MLLVDASVYIFRAFHSLPDSITDAQGRPVNAIHGYTVFLGGLLAGSEHTEIAVAFDESLTHSFRNELYPDYKANRPAPPPALVSQIAACRSITESLGLATLASPVYEADDLIGTLAAGSDAPVTIVTSDKDLAQLLGVGDTLWDYARTTRFDAAAIRAKFGVSPAQIPDYLALVGDRVDNIPGVPGIGARTAAALLTTVGDLEMLLAEPAAVAASGLRGARGLADRLRTHAEQARLSRQLATIVTDIALDDQERDIRRRTPDMAALHAICEQHGLGRRIRAVLGLGAQ